MKIIFECFGWQRTRWWGRRVDRELRVALRSVTGHQKPKSRAPSLLFFVLLPWPLLTGGLTRAPYNFHVMYLNYRAQGKFLYKILKQVLFFSLSKCIYFAACRLTDVAPLSRTATYWQCRPKFHSFSALICLKFAPIPLEMFEIIFKFFSLKNVQLWRAFPHKNFSSSKLRNRRIVARNWKIMRRLQRGRI